MHGLEVYMKEGLLFARDLSLENSFDSHLGFRLGLLHSVSYFFFNYQSPSDCMWIIWSIWPNGWVFVYKLSGCGFESRCYQSQYLSLCTVFDAISSNTNEVPLINPSTNVFVFGDFNVHHKDWLTYSGGTDRPGKLSYNFSISYNLT